MAQNITVLSPSGAKNYNYKKYNKNFPLKSVSHTTRKPRLNEVNGVDYNFVSQEIFEKLIKEKKFYEYAKIFDNYYGTLKDTVDKLIKTNDVIFDIDWQGTKQLSKFKNLNLIKIFISIIDKKELRMRLVKRNQDSTTDGKRFKSYDEDIKHWTDYDYVVINKDLENCFKQIEKIILGFKRKVNFPRTIE